jgi:hypothetical protein
MAERREKELCFNCDKKNSQEATDVTAFSTLKLLMIPRRKIRHESQLEDELCLHGGSSVMSSIV